MQGRGIVSSGQLRAHERAGGQPCGVVSTMRLCNVLSILNLIRVEWPSEINHLQKLVSLHATSVKEFYLLAPGSHIGSTIVDDSRNLGMARPVFYVCVNHSVDSVICITSYVKVE